MVERHGRGALVGRAPDLERLAALLEESRLVTIMGAGGVGKTQLALAASRTFSARYPGGVFIAELSPLTRDAEVLGAVASSMGGGPDRLAEFVAHQVAGQPALLVLDSCEHVLAGARDVIQALLDGAPSLAILVTSRERLRLPGELAWTLSGLAPADAAALLVERARHHDASFALTDANREPVLEICRRLDGIPLALELVAGRLAIVSAAALAGMLDDAVPLLTSDEMASRQGTLRATLDWSYDLLTVEQRSTLNRLSVFMGWFDGGDAAAVLGIDVFGALDQLAALRDRSLVVADTEHASPRFRLLEPIRQYARHRLGLSQDFSAALRQHCAFVMREADALSSTLLGVPGHQLDAVARFRQLLPDLRSAFAWALDNEPEWACRIASATAWAWDIAGELTEGRLLLSASLEADPGPHAAARILSGLTLLTDRLGGQALGLAERAVASGRAGGERHDLGYALFLLGFALRKAGRSDADDAYDEAAAIADECGDRLLRAWVDTIRTLTGDTFKAMAEGLGSGEQLLEARRAHEAGVEVALELGDIHSASIAVGNLAVLCHELGDDRAARRNMARYLDLLEMHGNWTVATRILSIASALAAGSGRFREALVLAGAFRRINDLAGRGDTREPKELGPARAALGPDLSKRLMAEGAALPIDRMFQLARVESAVTEVPGHLTPRELEVARLVAAGLANKEIARRFNRSERTVENHVAHALGKLGLESRSQLGGWLAQHGL